MGLFLTAPISLLARVVAAVASCAPATFQARAVGITTWESLSCSHLPSRLAVAGLGSAVITEQTPTDLLTVHLQAAPHISVHILDISSQIQILLFHRCLGFSAGMSHGLLRREHLSTTTPSLFLFQLSPGP